MFFDQPTLIAMNSSLNLRSRVCCWLSMAFFTYCWVMVEPPWVEPPFAMLNTARAMPIGSTPESVRNDAFSAAMAAFCIERGISLIVTFCRFVSPSRAMTLPLDQR